MPTLLDYRRRIRSVKSTQQITRAMKFVAAAKLRRAQEGVFAARPYAHEILRVLRSAAARMESTAHPCSSGGLRKDSGGGGDRRPQPGRCVQLERAPPRDAVPTRECIQKNELIAVGKKGRDTLESAAKFVGEYLNVSSQRGFPDRERNCRTIAELYAKREVDAVYAVYNEFKNVMVQNLRAGKTAADRSGCSPERRKDREPDPQPRRSAAPRSLPAANRLSITSTKSP